MAAIIACHATRSYNEPTMSGHDGILLEDMNHKLDAILEGQEAMGGVPCQIKKIDDRLRNVEIDVKAIKAVLKDHSKILNNHSGLLRGHSTQITELGQAAA
jgi:hypothetical protein